MKRSFIILLHTGYWILYLLLIISFIQIMPGSPRPHSFNQFFYILFLSPVGINFILPGVICFYTFYTWLFTRFLSHKKIIALCCMGLLICFVNALFSIVLSIECLPAGRITTKWSELVSMTIFVTVLALIHGIIGLIMRGFISWYADIKWKEELNRKNFETELSLVKSQINPHFLFNTIHNIDILIEKDPVKASAFLNKLSGIMRFMLYETKTEQVSLASELTNIENYIELEKIRTSNLNYIRYHVEGDAGGLMIPPMLFLPFIENAFKHAENDKAGNTISIQLEIAGEKLNFTCGNSYTSTMAGKPGGLGNELIRKRLELLYPGRHTLVITDNNGHYEANLILLLHAD